MKRARRTILFVEDEADIRLPVGRFFESNDFEVIEADTCATGLEAFRRSRPDVTVIDYSLPDGDGLTLVRAFRETDPGIPIVILTGHGTIDLAVQAIKQGAEQFLTKPVELPVLLAIVNRLIESSTNQRFRLAQESRETRAFDPFFGESPAILKLRDEARRVLGSTSSILIQGETGSGKGLLASWIHRNGSRRQDPFVDLNCAGLSRDFLESELFGHERGAFTGAVASKKGLIEIGHRGCVFLDEIGDLPLDVQPKLLKVVEDKKLRRLGEVTEREVDIRLIAASHKDLRELMARGLFREDLYYRLSTLPLRVPPLRQRGQDVLLLARELLVRLSADFGRPEARLSPGGERRLLAHSWPGNIRELRNVLERALLVEHANVIDVEDLAPSVAAPPVSAPPSPRADDAIETLAELEARHIDFVVARASGNVTEAARLLGLSRSALYERIRKHGLRGESASRIARRTSRSIGALD